MIQQASSLRTSDRAHKGGEWLLLAEKLAHPFVRNVQSPAFSAICSQFVTFSFHDVNMGCGDPVIRRRRDREL